MSAQEASCARSSGRVKVSFRSLTLQDALPYSPDLANNLATPALSEARQKRETSPRSSRPTAKDGSRVGAGFVARTIPSAGNRKAGRSGHARSSDPHAQGRRRRRLVGEHADDQPVAVVSSLAQQRHVAGVERIAHHVSARCPVSVKPC
jgi:hypothetical protein